MVRVVSVRGCTAVCRRKGTAVVAAGRILNAAAALTPSFLKYFLKSEGCFNLGLFLKSVYRKFNQFL